MSRSHISPFITTIVCSFMLFSAPLFASDNRPATQANTANAETSVKNQAITPPPATSTRTNSTKNTPSAVELMMQRQQPTTDQTLPATEIQPGTTIPVHTTDQPRRGASMREVKNELGEPLSTTPAVGKPPITKWIYNDRVVVFEYSRMIDAVARTK